MNRILILQRAVGNPADNTWENLRNPPPNTSIEGLAKALALSGPARYQVVTVSGVHVITITARTIHEYELEPPTDPQPA